MNNDKRITLLCGHYGSGKTNVAVNLAWEMRKKYPRLAVADLDIVNPYFRTKDSEDEFRESGIRLICSEYANSNLDIPSLPEDLYAITDDKDLHVIIDVGGDDRGALALGRLTPGILAENNYEMLMVVNRYRPLTRTPEETMEVFYEIENACGIPFTGIVNNSNLGRETVPEDVLASLPYAEEISRLAGIPVVMTTVEERLCQALAGKVPGLFPLRLQKKL